MSVSAESRRRSNHLADGRGEVQAGQDWLWGGAGFLAGTERQRGGKGRGEVGRGHPIKTAGFVPGGGQRGRDLVRPAAHSHSINQERVGEGEGGPAVSQEPGSFSHVCILTKRENNIKAKGGRLELEKLGQKFYNTILRHNGVTVRAINPTCRPWDFGRLDAPPDREWQCLCLFFCAVALRAEINVFPLGVFVVSLQCVRPCAYGENPRQGEGRFLKTELTKGNIHQETKASVHSKGRPVST